MRTALEMAEAASLVLRYRRGQGLADAMRRAWLAEGGPEPALEATGEGAVPLERPVGLCLVVSAADDAANLGESGFWPAADTLAGGAPLLVLAPATAPGDPLQGALEQLVVRAGSASTPLTLVRHGLLYGDLLLWRDPVRERRQLRLPMASAAPPWVAEADVAKLALDLLRAGSTGTVRVQGARYSGAAIAEVMSSGLTRILAGEGFSRRAFADIDLDGDGKLGPGELGTFLGSLGFRESVARAMFTQADRAGDGYIHYDEFVHGVGEQLAGLLAGIPREVTYLPMTGMAFTCEMTLAGQSEEVAGRYLALLHDAADSGVGESVEDPLDRRLGRPPLTLADWFDRAVMRFIRVRLIPGKGLLTVREGFRANRVARLFDLMTASGGLLHGFRSLDDKLVSFSRTDLASGELAHHRFVGEGVERELALLDRQLVGLRVEGAWRSLGDAMALLLGERRLSLGQLELFAQSGELGAEHVPADASVDEMLCTCTGATRGELMAMIGRGLDTLDAIASDSLVTEICGCCRGEVLELLGQRARG